MTNLLINNNKNETKIISTGAEKNICKTCAKALVETLSELGVDSVFGYPGAAVLSIYNELSKQEKIRHYLRFLLDDSIQLRIDFISESK